MLNVRNIVSSLETSDDPGISEASGYRGSGKAIKALPYVKEINITKDMALNASLRIGEQAKAVMLLKPWPESIEIKVRKASEAARRHVCWWPFRKWKISSMQVVAEKLTRVSGFVEKFYRCCWSR